MSFPVPPNEVGRIEAVKAFAILDSAPEIAYDELGELAAEICRCPVAWISFIDDDRLWLKAKYGLPAELNQCPREMGFCSVTICGAGLLESTDLSKDERFSNFAFVTSDPHFKFYCGMPLITKDGYALGTLCVVDFEPRELAFEQKESLRRLAHQVMGQLEYRRKLIELADANQELDRARAAIVAEKERAEALLTNILPEAIAEELKARGKVEPRYFPSASILFTDFREFTKFAERAEPAMLVGLLDQYFSSFDEIATRHGLEKLKTIGDAFMAVGGVPIEKRHHAIDACLAALDIRASVAKTNRQREKMRLPTLGVRIGIHSGPLMAGVVGRRKFTYDVWGDSVNVAARLEENGEAGRINVSDTVYNVVKPLFDLTQRGTIEMKNKAAIPMYFLDRIKAEFSKDPEGSTPNESFTAERKRAATRF